MAGDRSVSVAVSARGAISTSASFPDSHVAQFPVELHRHRVHRGEPVRRHRRLRQQAPHVAARRTGAVIRHFGTCGITTTSNGVLVTVLSPKT